MEIDFKPGWLCVLYASHRGLDKHLSDLSLWADCHSVGRKLGNIWRSFAGRTLEQNPNDFVPFGFILCRLGFVRRHWVSDDGTFGQARDLQACTQCARETMPVQREALCGCR